MIDITVSPRLIKLRALIAGKLPPWHEKCKYSGNSSHTHTQTLVQLYQLPIRHDLNIQIGATLKDVNIRWISLRNSALKNKIILKNPLGGWNEHQGEVITLRGIIYLLFESVWGHCYKDITTTNNLKAITKTWYIVDSAGLSDWHAQFLFGWFSPGAVWAHSREYKDWTHQFFCLLKTVSGFTEAWAIYIHAKKGEKRYF